MRPSALLLLISMCLALAACDDTPSDSVAAALRTPEGNEVSLTCPPSLTDADPDKLATAMAQFNIHTPSSFDAVETLVPPEAPNSLRTLIPRNSLEGPVDCCDSSTNSGFGAPFGGGGMFGFGAGEEQLIQMGRLCGIFAESRPALRMRVDLYVATPGATEAFKREARAMEPGYLRESVEPEDQQLLNSIGEERTLTRVLMIQNDQRLDNDDYEILFRRRNVIARIELNYGSFSAPAKGPPEPLLQYAAQLDQNIEAAAQQHLQ